MDLTYMLDKATNEKISLYALIVASAIFIPYQTDWVAWNTFTTILLVVVGILSIASTIYRYVKRKEKAPSYRMLSAFEVLGAILYVVAYTAFYKQVTASGIHVFFILCSLIFLLPFIAEIILKEKE